MKKIIIFLGCLLCIMMSCSHEPAIDNGTSDTNVHEWEDSTINGNATMSQMKFSIGQDMVVERSAQTRATTTIAGVATFSVGDLIAIAVTKSGGSEIVKPYRVKSDGSLEYAGSDEAFVWKSTSESVSIRAWSYGTSSISESSLLTLPESSDYSLETNQQTNGYKELLYCKSANKSYSSSPMTLNFYHQLSRLVINVSHDLSTALSVSSVSVGNAAFPRQAGFTPPTGSSNVGTWTIRSTNLGTITPKTETTQSGYQATYSAVVFPKTYAKDSKIFTLTNSDGNYSYTITESAGQALTAGNQYTFAINVRDDIKKNPLWWMAQYNMAEGGTSFVTEHSTTDQYCFDFIDAKCANISGYHVPTRNQLLSILPSDVATATESTGTNIANLTNTLASPYEFSEQACVVGGNTVAASTSIIGKKADWDYYAIRFINTAYCSAWHYKWVTSPCNGLLIESYLLSGVTTVALAKAKLAESGFATTTFTGTVNSSTANQTPGNTTVKAKCFVQRFLPACGNHQEYQSVGSGIAAAYMDNIVNYMSSTSQKVDTCALLIANKSSVSFFLGRYPKKHGRSVRLFKDWGCSGSGKTLTTSVVGDIICSHGKIYSATANDLPCGGVKVAIIAYKGNGENNSSYNKGLAIAVEDNKYNSVYKWFTTSSGTCSGEDLNLSNLTNYRGIEYTNKLANATCTSGHVHQAALQAKNYPVHRPSGTSQWFLPTIGQWNLIVKALTGSSTNLANSSSNDTFKAANVNTKIIAAGGLGFTTSSAYWSTTERNTENVWRVNFNLGGAYWTPKIGADHVRPVLAF